MNRLSNRTTNADVLDRLAETHTMVLQELNGTKLAINQQMLDNKASLAQTQVNIKDQMDATQTHINDVINDAETHLGEVQLNMTDKISLMGASVDKAVKKLDIDVSAAEARIHDDVNVLQKNMEKYVTLTNKQFEQEDDFVKYQLAGTFTLLACLMSIYHVTGHFRHLNKPEIQRRIMAVLWMVPMYSTTSWLSLVLPYYEYLFGTIRDSYEAYAIYTFVGMLESIVEDVIKNNPDVPSLVAHLTDHVNEERTALAKAMEENTRRPVMHLSPPFACCYDWNRPSSVAKAWLYQCKMMAIQFVLMKPTLSLVPLIFWLLKIDYDSHSPFDPETHSINWTSPKLYVLLSSNISVAIAFWGLLNFYHGMEKDLEWCNPWPKFLCIKGVVFMTFWQGLALQGMSIYGYVDERKANQIQNLLTCIEMLIASLAHVYIFPYQEWADNYRDTAMTKIRLRDTFALNDFATDLHEMANPSFDYDPQSPRVKTPGSNTSMGSVSAASQMSMNSVESSRRSPDVFQSMEGGLTTATPIMTEITGKTDPAATPISTTVSSQESSTGLHKGTHDGESYFGHVPGRSASPLVSTSTPLTTTVNNKDDRNNGTSSYGHTDMLDPAVALTWRESELAESAGTVAGESTSPHVTTRGGQGNKAGEENKNKLSSSPESDEDVWKHRDSDENL